MIIRMHFREFINLTLKEKMSLILNMKLQNSDRISSDCKNIDLQV